MKIIRIDINRVHVPLTTGPVDPIHSGNSGYVPTEKLHKHIVQLHTDEGLTGVGETWKGTPDAAVIATAEWLLHADPLKLTLVNFSPPHDKGTVNARDLGEMVPVRPIDQNPSIHAYDVAIADLKGQATGLSIAQMLGGPVRENVLVHFWAPRLSPKETARVAKKGKSLGFGGIKLKCTLEDPNIETVKAIYEACGPNFRITLDPNQRFQTIEKTLELDEALSGYPIETIEDPLPKEDFCAYATLRKSLSVPLALHLERPDDVIEAIRLQAADVFNLRGTINSVNRLGYVAEIAGMKIWRGSGIDLGILDASYAHVCAATPSCTYGSDIIGQFFREDDLIVEPLTYENGYINVPCEPGLGVQLDQDALEQYTVRCTRSGERKVWKIC